MMEISSRLIRYDIRHAMIMLKIETCMRHICQSRLHIYNASTKTRSCYQFTLAVRFTSASPSPTPLPHSAGDRFRNDKCVIDSSLHRRRRHPRCTK